MKGTLRFLTPALALAGILSACGTGSGPDLSGPNGAAYLAAYSGDWVLLPLESEDLDAKMREGMGARAGTRGATGNMPGAGGATGERRPPGGMSGGRPGGGRGGMPGGAGATDPEEMQRLMRATLFLARTPGNLTLTLRSESVTLVQGTDAPVRMVLDGDEAAVTQGEFEYLAGAKWTDEGLVIERRVRGGGGVTDKISVDDESHLVVAREIDTGRRKVEGILRYRESEG